MTKLSDAFNALAEAAATLSIELEAADADEGPQPPSGAPVEASWTETDDWVEPKESGSAAVCPAHGEPYKDGNYGLFCTQLGTDPKWTNARGYCTVTPKNAAAYLRQKAAR